MTGSVFNLSFCSSIFLKLKKACKFPPFQVKGRGSKTALFLCFFLTGCAAFNPPPTVPETPLTPTLSLPPAALISVLLPKIIKITKAQPPAQQAEKIFKTAFTEKLSLALSETGNPALPFSQENRQLPVSHPKAETLTLQTTLLPEGTFLLPLFSLKETKPSRSSFLQSKSYFYELHGLPFPDREPLPFFIFQQNARLIAAYLQRLRPAAKIFTLCSRPRIFIAEASGLSAQNNRVLTVTVRRFLRFNGAFPVSLKEHPLFLLIPQISRQNIPRQTAAVSAFSEAPSLSFSSSLSKLRLTLTWQLFRLQASKRRFLVTLTQTHLLPSGELKQHWPQIALIAVQNLIPALKNQLQSACLRLHRQD